jgi:flagellar biosynthetic protein FliR
MPFTSWSTEELLCFFLVLVRISTMMALLPIFGDKSIPSTVKILLSLSFAAILYPILRSNGVIDVAAAAEWSRTTGSLLITVGTEVLTGLAVGFASQLVFHSIHAAGDIMATLMGLSMASMYDPHTENQTLVMGQLLGTLAMLTFLALDGHHLIFRAMIETFRLIPQGHFVINEGFKNSLVHLSGNVILFGLQLAAPMAACMLLVNIVYGILGKALPQLNILTLSMASSVCIGGFVLLVTYPSVQNGMSNIFNTYFEDLRQFMVVYGGK